jgi:hypothetical protein
VNKAVALMDRSGAGRKRVKLLCVQTGEVATLKDWSVSFAKEIGGNERSVSQAICRARRLNEKWRGLTFEVVP